MSILLPLRALGDFSLPPSVFEQESEIILTDTAHLIATGYDACMKGRWEIQGR